MTFYKDFTEYLNVEKFFKDEPQTLDDEWPDAYEKWFDEQDPYDLIKWADEFSKIQRQELLEALKGLIACDLMKNLVGGYQYQIEQAEEAITKAEGK